MRQVGWVLGVRAWECQEGLTFRLEGYVGVVGAFLFCVCACGSS